MIGLFLWTIDVLPFVVVTSFGSAAMLFVVWLIMRALPESAYPGE